MAHSAADARAAANAAEHVEVPSSVITMLVVNAAEHMEGILSDIWGMTW
jgi:hypothetical protein